MSLVDARRRLAVGQALLPDITAHPLWFRLKPAIIVETGPLLASGHRHRRVELRTLSLSSADVERILSIRVACAACGKSIRPFRHRRGKQAGRARRPCRLFVALTCELVDSIGCSRGRAATAAYERLLVALRPAATPSMSTGGAR